MIFYNDITNKINNLYDRTNIEDHVNLIISLLGLKRDKHLYNYIKYNLVNNNFSSYHLFWIRVLAQNRQPLDFFKKTWINKAAYDNPLSDKIQREFKFKKEASILYVLNRDKSDFFVESKKEKLLYSENIDFDSMLVSNFNNNKYDVIIDLRSSNKIQPWFFTKTDDNRIFYKKIMGSSLEDLNYLIGDSGFTTDDVLFFNDLVEGLSVHDKRKFLKRMINYSPRELLSIINMMKIIEPVFFKGFILDSLLNFKTYNNIYRNFNMLVSQIYEGNYIYDIRMNYNDEKYKLWNIIDNNELIKYSYYFSNCIALKSYKQKLTENISKLFILKLNNKLFCIEYDLDNRRIIEIKARYNQVPKILNNEIHEIEEKISILLIENIS